jgi:hypothetical protein
MLLDLAGFSGGLKDIAPILSITSAILALLLDQFRVFPKRLASYVFWYGALIVGGFWVVTRLLNGPAWSHSTPTTRSLLTLQLTAYVAFVAFAVARMGILPDVIKVKEQGSVASPPRGIGVVAPRSIEEPLDEYWKLSDFAVLAVCRNRNSRTLATTNLRLTGGSVLLDVALNNLTEDPLLLDELECKTKSRAFPIYHLGFGAGMLPISGVYHIYASVGNVTVSEPMEPRLHLPGKDAVRFLILFTPDTNGYDGVAFQFQISIKSAAKSVSRIGPFRLWPQQLETSSMDAKAELERRISADPNDVITLAKYAQLLRVEGDRSGADEVFASIDRLAPGNIQVLELRLKDRATTPDDKLDCYYRLREINPDAAASLRYEVIGPLIGRAQKERVRHDFDAYRRTLGEIQQVSSGYGLGREVAATLTREEIFLAMITDDINTAAGKVRSLAEREKWNEEGGGE